MIDSYPAGSGGGGGGAGVSGPSAGGVSSGFISVPPKNNQMPAGGGLIGGM